MAPLDWPSYDSYQDSGFEWLDAIPAGWIVKRLKHVTRQVSDKVSSADISLPYIGMENVESWSGRLVEGGSEVEGLAAKFSAGDVIFGKLRPYLAKAAKLEFPGMCSTEFIVFRTTPGLEPDFLAYLLRSAQFVSFVDSSTYGSKMPRANPSFIANCPVGLPPPQEQRVIAAFLDEKCAKVDEAVRIKEEQIALLRERRQILIQEAVTRGLNPDAPMKDSGVDWIGPIPAHWEVENPKWLFKHRKERARKGEQQLAATQKYGVIPQSDFMEMEGRRVTQVFLDFGILKHVEAGDFVMSMRSFQGGLEYSEHTGCVSSAYVALEPGPRVFAPFYKYLFKSARYIEALQSTSNLVRDGQALRFDNFAMVMLPALPLEEQREIAEFLDGELLKSDAGISIKESQVAVLKEYKTTLINAAVTGKIKVA